MDPLKLPLLVIAALLALVNGLLGGLLDPLLHGGADHTSRKGYF